METEDENTEEIVDANLLSSSIVGKNIQETLKEDERDVMESKEEVVLHKKVELQSMHPNSVSISNLSTKNFSL